jgi:hypothetical protein
MNTKEMVEYIDSIQSGRIVSEADVERLKAIRERLATRLSAGRPRIHADAKARYAFHNAKKRAKQMIPTSIDITDTVN